MLATWSHCWTGDHTQASLEMVKTALVVRIIALVPINMDPGQEKDMSVFSGIFDLYSVSKDTRERGSSVHTGRKDSLVV